MQKISLIAAVDEHFGLGKDNQLFCHLPADLRHFKEITWGKPVIMGKNTFLSIGKPLPGRQNIVLTHGPGFPGVEISASLVEALHLVRGASEIMIIGGGALFESALPLANYLYLTCIYHHFQADVFFPNLDTKLWHCVDAQLRLKDEKNLYDMTFYEFKKCEK